MNLLTPPSEFARVDESCEVLAYSLINGKKGLDTMLVRDVLKLLRMDGWVEIYAVGSHRQFKHPTKKGKVTVAGHPSMDLHPATLKSILRQAQLEEKK